MFRALAAARYRWRWISAFFVLPMLAACVSQPDDTPAPRVLFVGNSLTYYNDLPAKFAAMQGAAPVPSRIETEMLAEGGASLRDRIDDGSLARVLAAQRYDVVVLQDFGSWPLCPTTIPACEDGDASLREAVALARRHGARPLWFGTWLSSRRGMQQPLSTEGQRIASLIGVQFADIGGALEGMPDVGLPMREDDGHPADAGSWVAAAVLWQSAFPARPLPVAPPEACISNRRSKPLRGDVPASSQRTGPARCSRPASVLWDAIRAQPTQ